MIAACEQICVCVCSPYGLPPGVARGVAGPQAWLFPSVLMQFERATPPWSGA